jgi:hypothetical protein
MAHPYGAMSVPDPSLSATSLLSYELCRAKRLSEKCDLPLQWGCGMCDQASIEDHFPIARGIESGIEIEIGTLID